MRSFASILEQIRLTQFAHFRLYVREGYSDNFIGSSWENEELKPEESIRLLENLVGFYQNEPGTLFSIELFKSAKSSGTGKTSKLAFMVDPNQQPARVREPAQALEGLSGGLGAVTQHFEMRLKLEAEMAEKRLDQRDRENALARKEEQLAERMAAFAAEKAATEAELKGLQKTYESHTAVVENALGRFTEKAILDLMSGGPGLGQAPGLAGPSPESEQPNTPEFKLVEQVAEEIHKAVTDLEELKVWGLISNQFILEPTDPVFNYFRQRVKDVKLVEIITPATQ